MTGIRLQANQELIAQGVGNMVIPFFGGVPATAAIARSSVGIKSGGQTRLVSIVHAVGLLLSMFLLTPFMERIPMPALAGVRMNPGVRLNEWDAIKFMFGKPFKTDMIAFTITMLATIVLDLTQAILIGTFLAAAVFMNKLASIDITVQEVDIEKLRQKGIETEGKCRHVRVAFLTGPLFFAATGQFNEAFANLGDTHALILSMRGVSLIDTAGLEAVHRLHERLHKQGGTLMFAGIHDNARQMMERDGIVELGQILDPIVGIGFIGKTSLYLRDVVMQIETCRAQIFTAGPRTPHEGFVSTFKYPLTIGDLNCRLVAFDHAHPGQVRIIRINIMPQVKDDAVITVAAESLIRASGMYTANIAILIHQNKHIISCEFLGIRRQSSQHKFGAAICVSVNFNAI